MQLNGLTDRTQPIETPPLTCRSVETNGDYGHDSLTEQNRHRSRSENFQTRFQVRFLTSPCC